MKKKIIMVGVTLLLCTTAWASSNPVEGILIKDGRVTNNADNGAVADSVQISSQLTVSDRIFANSGVRSDALEGGGSYIAFPNGGVVIKNNFQTHEADFEYTGGIYDRLMTDAEGEFTSGNVSDWVIVRTGSLRGAMAEITDVLDSDNVILHTMGWDFDITDFGYFVVEHPQMVVGDGYHNEFQCDGAGHFDIHSLDYMGNSYSKYLFEVELGAGKQDVDGALFKTEANGYSQIDSLVVDYMSGDLTVGGSGGGIGVRVDVSEAVNADSTTEVTAITSVLSNGSSATTTAMKVLPGFTNALKVEGATPEDPDYGYEVSGGGATETDRVNSGGAGNDAFINNVVNETIFDSVNDYILIGSDAKFELVSIYLATTSSKNITPTFFYSKAGGGWKSLTLKSDGTNGFLGSGFITFNAPTDWTADDESMDGTAITNAYYIAIKRTYNPTIPVKPVELYIKTYALIETGMRIKGDGIVCLTYIGAAPSGVENGDIWMESDGLHIYFNNQEDVLAN